MDSSKSSAKKSKKESDVIPVAADVLTDGTVIEMLYDPIEGKTSLASYRDGRCTIGESYSYAGKVLVPHKASKEILKNGVVLFPSSPKPFGSQEDLLKKIGEFIHRYLSVSESFEKLASYYVLFSWVHDDFSELPYLRAIGEYGTGKSRFLKVVGSICYRPIFVGTASASAIFRVVNDFRGTVVWDEADFRDSDTTAEVIKILNNGFSKGSPVLRVESTAKKDFDVKAFNVFGPKIIATRFTYSDAALESRMLTEDMNLHKPKSEVPFNIPEVFWSEALELRNHLLTYRFERKGHSVLHSEYENRSIEPRLNQVSVPLMSIIENPNDLAEVQAYFLSYDAKIRGNRKQSRRYQIFESICFLIDAGYTEPTMKEIADQYNLDCEWKERISPRKMGSLVKSMFDLKTERRNDGYHLTAENKEKIEFLRGHIGIPQKKDGEHVNDVNDGLGKDYEDIPVINSSPF